MRVSKGAAEANVRARMLSALQQIPSPKDPVPGVATRALTMGRLGYSCAGYSEHQNVSRNYYGAALFCKHRAYELATHGHVQITVTPIIHS